MRDLFLPLDLPTQHAGAAKETNPASLPFDNSLAIDSDVRAAFWSRVVRSPSCWFWTGAISSEGYGRFTWQRGKKQRTISAHRLTLLLSGIELSPGDVAEHFCNEPLCVRVDSEHVHVSDQSANIRYAVALGRHRGNIKTVRAGEDDRARSLRIRDALRGGWDSEKFARAIAGVPSNQLALFGDKEGE